MSFTLKVPGRRPNNAVTRGAQILLYYEHCGNENLNDMLFIFLIFFDIAR
jgi:hypothetical protein